MSVNTLSTEQAYTLVAALCKQATGEDALTPTDLSSFISVANRTMAAGLDKVYSAISVVVGKTLVAVRPYDRKFKGLEFEPTVFGGIIRKISFIDDEPLRTTRYDNVDGTSVDPFIIRKQKAVETRYTGKDTYDCQRTIYDYELKEAFNSPESFGSFMAGLMTHFSNEREQWKEALSRTILTNTIAADSIIGGDKVVHLLSEYNAETKLNLDDQTVRQPENVGPFTKWAYARIGQVRKLMTERSGKYQLQLNAGRINRHTPLEDQRMYLDQNLLDHMKAEVLSGTYHDNYLSVGDVEGITYWQSIESPNSIHVKPVYINADGQVVEGANTQVDKIVGIIFDKDALGYSTQLDEMTSIYNPRAHYTNIFGTTEVRLMNDLTEKSVVFLLD